MITRFAPSPTGPLHIGHAYSALLAHDTARAQGGTFLLRIEDFDSTRRKPVFIQQIYDDLAWLGVTWDAPPRLQSDHLNEYAKVIDRLAAMDLVFPCNCGRKTVLETGALAGPDGPIYPYSCADRPFQNRRDGDAIRLDLRKAQQHLPDQLHYINNGQQVIVETANLPFDIGAPILRRKDTGDIAYHLACTHDDATQGITHIIRGEDVSPLTPIHVVLQSLMGWATPTYQHHGLITDDTGKRLAKIDKSKSIASYRADGATPADIRRMVGLPVSSV